MRLVMQTDGNLNSKFPGILLDDFNIESDLPNCSTWSVLA